MTDRVALITGVTGQDGAYLASALLRKGYTVHGIKRRTSLISTDRVDSLYADPHVPGHRFHLHFGDVTDSSNLIRLVQECQPTEIYNLAAQSHVLVSFETPEYTADADALGTLRLLEAVRLLGLTSRVRFYQASSSEMFGLVQEIPQTERTPFHPRSPYGVSKLFSHWITVNYREAYGLFACSGILFNHESPLRGETFVTRKIARAAAVYARGDRSCLYLGNLEARRDWGHSRDYVEAMWLMLQAPEPDDFVIATGETHSVRDFCTRAFERVGVQLEWRGRESDEVGLDSRDGTTAVRVDPRYFRPAEVDVLVGDASKARDQLGWTPRTRFQDLVNEMVDAEVGFLETGTSAVAV